MPFLTRQTHNDGKQIRDYQELMDTHTTIKRHMREDLGVKTVPCHHSSHYRNLHRAKAHRTNKRGGSISLYKLKIDIVERQVTDNVRMEETEKYTLVIT